MKPFKEIFKSISGIDYNNQHITLNKAAFEKLPIIVYKMAGKSSPDSAVEIEMPPESYAERVGASYDNLSIK